MHGLNLNIEQFTELMLNSEDARAILANLVVSETDLRLPSEGPGKNSDTDSDGSAYDTDAN